MSAFVLVLLALASCLPCQAKPQPDKARGNMSSHALLIGCTQYPQLRGERGDHDLTGPANDVVLLRNLLIEKYLFTPQNIITLTEGPVEAFRPTRANIIRELRSLSGKVHAGDRVVISLSGHGSQQPDQFPPDPKDPEPDGLDEILLPADAGFSRDGRTVENALVDDDLHALLDPIVKTGADVLVVLDACQSGTATRGDVVRSVPPEELFPAGALAEAAARARKRGPTTLEANLPAFELPNAAPELVAIYAALPTESTIELPLPPGLSGGPRETYGLLTYTLSYVLSNSQTPLTYQDLIDRVYAQYNAWGRTSPTPLVEGSHRDFAVLGGAEQKERSIVLRRTPSDTLRIDAGALRGLSEGTVLAVHPAAGSPVPDQVLGHVRIPPGGLRVLDAFVEPCASLEPGSPKPAPASFPPAARCEPVVINMQDRETTVAIEVADPEDSGKFAAELSEALKERADRPTSLYALVDDPIADRPAWLVRVEPDGVYLVRAADLGRGGTSLKPEAPRFGPAPRGDEQVAWIDERLTRIARVESLRQIATRFQIGSASAGPPLGLDARMLVLKDPADPGTPLGQGESGPPTLRDGDIFTCELANRGKVPLDVSVLFLTPDYGIEVYYPEPDRQLDNRIPPQKSLRAALAELNAETEGVEQLVVIAVEAPEQGQPYDFSSLRQPGIGETERSAANTLREQLDRLFPTGLRQIHPSDIERIEFRTFTWRIRKREAPGK